MRMVRGSLNLHLSFRHKIPPICRTINMARQPSPAPASARVTGMAPLGTLGNLPALVDELAQQRPGLVPDGWSLLGEFGLGREAFARPLQPISVVLCGEILQRAIAVTACDHLPLLLGARARLENVGPLRLLIQASQRVRAAILSLIRFRRVWYNGFRLVLSEESNVACVALDFAGSFSGRDAVCAAYATALSQHLKAIIGPQWQLLAAHLSRPQPADVSPYRQHFGQTPQFGQRNEALYFPARLLDLQRAVEADAGLFEFLRRQLLLMESALGLGFAEQVGQLIETLLMSGRCDIERVASVLGMHRHTLYRRLRNEATDFESLLDEKRRQLAMDMLRRPNLPIGEISEALGYSAAANFTRAFCRWNGVAPAAWRQEHAAGGDP